MAITRITGSKWLVDGSVTNIKLATDSVTTVKILDANVTTPKLADSAVTTAKILDGNVTPIKMDATGDYLFNSVNVGGGNTVLSSDGTITTKGGNLIVQNTAGNTNVLTVDAVTETITTSGSLVIGQDLTVQGTTTSVNSTTLDVTDANITVGKGGTVASANGSGITVEITDGTNGSLIYDASAPVKWKAGDLGSEDNLVGQTVTQTLTNKTYNLTGAPIQGETDVESAVRALNVIAGGTPSTFYGDLGSAEVTGGGLTVTIAGATQIDAVYASGIRLSLGAANDYTVSGNVITLAESLLGNIVVDYTSV